MFRRRQFFRGAAAPHAGRDDLDWYRPDGLPMTTADWGNPDSRALVMALSGATGVAGALDDPFLIMFNAWWDPLAFTVPTTLRDAAWQVELDTADPHLAGTAADATAPLALPGRSLRVLRATGTV